MKGPKRELRIYRITDAGPKENEDSCFVVQHTVSLDEEMDSIPVTAALACMADGVSSQSLARFSSDFITGCVEDWYDEEGDRIFRSEATEVMENMHDLVMEIHEDLKKESDKRNISVGSTMDLAVMGKRKLFVTHVGDSRVYVYDGKDLVKVTEDQTVAQTEKVTGIRYNEVAENRKEHYLMQCMGVGDISPYQYEVNIPVTCDILLCTDGLTNRLTSYDITTELKKKQTGNDALLSLVKMARKRGEPDNITAILLRRREKPDRQAKGNRK